MYHFPSSLPPSLLNSIVANSFETYLTYVGGTLVLIPLAASSIEGASPMMGS